MSSGLSSMVAILLSINVAFTSASAQTIPHSFVVEGRLYNQADGSPLSDASTTVMLEVVTENDPSCVLYRETHAGVDFSNATDPSAVGVFALELGTGVAAPLAKPSFVTLFSPGTFTGVGGCTVTADPGDHRYVRIGISNALNSFTYEYFPLAMITSVPTAVVAENASTLQGYGTSGFIMTNTDVTQSNLNNIFSVTNYGKLTNLLNGTSASYMPAVPSAAVDFNNQRLINVATPATGAAGLNNAVNRTYADANVAGQTVNPALATLVGPGTGSGKVMAWDAAANRWTAALPVDATKLPLSGGLMSGAIDMGNNQILNSGNISLSPGYTFSLGRFTNAQETTLLATLPVGTPGASWYNTDTGTYKIWNGTVAVEQANLIAGKLNSSWLPDTTVASGTYGSSTLIPVLTVGSDGRITAAYGTSFSAGGASGAAGGDLTGTYPNPAMAANAVTTAKINDDAITAAKIKSSGVAINRLIATDAVTPNTLVYFECSINGQIMSWTATGWSCTTVASLAPVKTVQGKTPDASGNVPLNAYDIAGIASAATKDYGTAAGNLVELDGTGRIPASVMPSGLGTITQVSATAPLFGGGTSGSVTVSIDVGTGANQVVRLDGSALLPAVDGSALKNVNANSIGTHPVGTALPSPSQVLAWDGAQWVPTPASAGSVASVVSGTGLVAGTIVANGTINVDVGSIAGRIVQVGAGNLLPPIDGSLLFNLDAAKIGTRVVSSSGPSLNQVLTWNGSQWEPSAASTGTVTNVTSGTGLVPGTIVGAGTISVNVGTTAGQVMQFDGVARYPANDGSLISNVTATKLQTYPISSAAPGTNQVLTWNGSLWMGANAPTGDFKSDGSVSMTGQLLGYTGSAITPSYSFASDTNTGMYLGGADTLGFATGGLSAMTLGPSGRVGIGTTAPASTLDIVQNQNAETSISITNAMNGVSAEAGISLANNSGTMGYLYTASTGYSGSPLANDSMNLESSPFSSGLNLGAGGSGFIRFWTNTPTAVNERMRLTSDGKLGIGTASPGSVALEVVGTGANNSAILIPRNTTALRPAGMNGMLRYNTNTNRFEFFENAQWVNYGTGAGSLSFPLLASPGITTALAPSYSFTGDADTGMLSPAVDNISLATAGAPRLNIDPAGNVGIGTTNPQAALDIAASGAQSAIIVPRDSGSSRPTTPVGGMLRFNTDANSFEGYDGTAWQVLLTLNGGTMTGPLSTNYPITISGSSGGNLNLLSGANINMGSGTINSVSQITGASALTVQAGGTNQDLTLQGSGTGFVRIPNGGGLRVQVATDSTSVTTGAAVISGGLGVAKSMFVGGNLTAAGVVTAGTATFSPYVYGTTAAGGSLTIDSTSNVTKGAVNLIPSGGSLKLAESGTAAFLVGQYGNVNTVLAPYGTGKLLIGTMNPAPSGALVTLYNTASTQIIEMTGTTSQASGAILSRSQFGVKTTAAASGIYSGFESSLDFFTPTGSPGAITSGLSGAMRLTAIGLAGKSYGVMGSSLINVGSPVQELAGVYGTAGNGTNTGSAQILSGVKGEVGLISGASHSTAAALRGLLTSVAGATAGTAAAGIFEASGNFTNSPALYGIYIGDLPTAGGAGSYGIFQTGISNKNFFAGKVGVGTTSPGSVALEVYGTGVNHSAILIPRDTAANRPAGTNGMLRYNATSNRFEGFEDGEWKDLIQTSRTSISQFEEFMSVPNANANATTPVGTTLFTSGVAGGISLSPVTPTNNLEAGIARMIGTTASGQNAAVGFCGNAVPGITTGTVWLGSNAWIFEARVRLSALSVTNNLVRVGLVGASNQYVDSNAGGLFFQISSATAVATATASNLSTSNIGGSGGLSSGVWYTYKIVWDGSAYSFYLNGSSITAPGGSLPSGATACPGIFVVSNGIPSLARNVDVDYISFTHQIPGR